MIEKTVLITGSSGGLGSALVSIFYANNYQVVINHLDDEKNVKELITRIGINHDRCLVVNCSVADPDAVKMMFSQIREKFGNLNILINNAGLFIKRINHSMPYDEWQKIIKVNLYGAVYCAKYALPLMLKNKKGTIINVSSTAAINCIDICSAAYQASKGALLGFTRTLAKEMAGQNIIVKAVMPGLIDNGIGLKATNMQKEKYLKKIPAGKYLLAKDVARYIYFHSTEDSSSCVGSCNIIDNGLTI